MNLGMTDSFLGLFALLLFAIAYIFVMSEDFHGMRKSKPVVLASGIIWALVAIQAKSLGMDAKIVPAVQESLVEYVNLFLFLLVAMTYVNTLEERNIFEALKGWLLKKQLSFRSLFWITGSLAFIISPVADNMTTALLMCAVILALDATNKRFIAISCVNIVVAANAGGAFSPFGDITTLMVWQKGAVPFLDFFHLLVPAIVNFVLPAFCMMWAIPKGIPEPHGDNIQILPGGFVMIVLFLLTITTAVLFNHFLHLPACVGMMTGFGYLQIYSYFVSRKELKLHIDNPHSLPFDIFRHIRQVEWDTLLFFYGVMLCIAGLAAFGYLELSSQWLYHGWGDKVSVLFQQSFAHIMIGILSAIIDNIPLMYAVLTMDPQMSLGQWLLITLTAGVGGSLLSIGSAAGVALMGQAKGHYTFISHLKWTWAILLGYFAAIAAHFAINYPLFKEFSSGI